MENSVEWLAPGSHPHGPTSPVIALFTGIIFIGPEAAVAWLNTVEFPKLTAHRWAEMAQYEIVPDLSLSFDPYLI